MLAARKRREMAQKLASRARSRFGEMKRRKIRPALDQLILGVLWRYNSTRRAARILKGLHGRFVDWNEVRVSSAAEVASAISTAPWAKVAAERITAVLQSLFDLRNLVSLEFLRELTTTQGKAFLQSLVGVGRDLADEVLLFSLRAEVLPVSEDTARMCCRLGLISSDRATLVNQKALADLWEPALYAPVALFFVDTARSVCRLDKPRCRECPMGTGCPKVGL